MWVQFFVLVISLKAVLTNMAWMLKITGMLIYRDEGGPHIHCMVTFLHDQPASFLGASTCLYDDWGNYLGNPSGFYVEYSEGQVFNVTRVHLHPHFWLTSTQNNVAVFEVNMSKDELNTILPWAIEVAEDYQFPKNCQLVTYNVDNGVIHIDRTEIVDRDRFCYRQMYPLALRLRYDNLCAKIPHYGVHIEVERRYAGAPIICSDRQIPKRTREDTEKGKIARKRPMRPNARNVFGLYVYAILSFNYRCENIYRTAVFTKLSYHKTFIMDPAKFVIEVLSGFNKRHAHGFNRSSSKSVKISKLLFYFMVFLLC